MAAAPQRASDAQPPALAVCPAAWPFARGSATRAAFLRHLADADRTLARRGSTEALATVRSIAHTVRHTPADATPGELAFAHEQVVDDTMGLVLALNGTFDVPPFALVSALLADVSAVTARLARYHTSNV